jgi:CHASE2 domain-containing sensor protein
LSRTFIEWLMVTALCAGMAAAMTAQDWLWRLDGVFYDAAMVSRQRVANPDVVIVAIDDRSLSEIGRWPWDRAVHAALLERLTELGASVIAMDVMFHEPAADKPAGDAALAAAIERHGPAAACRRFLRSLRKGHMTMAPMATTMVARIPSREPRTLIPAPGPM